MRIKSIKFGGTSMGSADSIAKCCNIIRSTKQTHKVVVVVSAVAGITDKLLSIVKFAKEYKPNMVDLTLNEIESTHKIILHDIIENDEINRSLWRQYFNPLIERLTTVCHSVIVDITDKMIARICSYGELFASQLISIALVRYKVSNQVVVSDKLIRTNCNSLKANVNFEVTNIYCKKILIPMLHGDIIPIVTGFIAKDAHGNITLLGRGGSDYTASIIGNALGVDTIEIWTDVDGIMTADPKIVKNACSWNMVDANMVSDLALCGAKIIHPETVINTSVPIDIFNTFNDKFGGTRIVRGKSDARSIVKSINKSLITVKNIKSINYATFLHGILSVMLKYRIPIEQCITSGSSFNLVINTEDYSDQVTHMLKQLGELEIEHKIVKLSLVGNKIGKNVALIKKVCHILTSLRVNIHVISVCTPNNNITLLINENKSQNALIELHNQLLIG